MKLLSDIMSHLATNMPHIAPFEGSKRHGAPSDAAGTICHLKIFLIVVQFEWHYLETQVTLYIHSKKTQPQNQ